MPNIPIECHIAVEGEPLCSYSIWQSRGELCGHNSKASAIEAARRLRPHFKRGRVKVVEGRCPAYFESYEVD